MRTSELTGPALDWAVAKCEYDTLAALTIQFPEQAKFYPKVSPSTDWAQGGSIIERERICLMYAGAPSHDWIATYSNPWIHGPTPLVAAMRCYVASKLGHEVDVPKELPQ